MYMQNLIKFCLIAAVETAQFRELTRCDVDCQYLIYGNCALLIRRHLHKPCGLLGNGCHGDRCALKQTTLFYGWLLPMSIIILHNLVVFGLVLRVLCRKQPGGNRLIDKTSCEYQNWPLNKKLCRCRGTARRATNMKYRTCKGHALLH